MTELNTGVELTLTRRRLVVSGGAAMAGLYVIGSRPAAASAASAPAYLRRASYTSHTGAAFTAVSPTGTHVTLRLVAVADLARAQQTASLIGSDDAFALTFSGAASNPLGSGIRRLRHPSLGWISLFVTPAGRATATQQDYEVVVDRASVS
jgi:hypothetical protein